MTEPTHEITDDMWNISSHNTGDSKVSFFDALAEGQNISTTPLAQGGNVTIDVVSQTALSVRGHAQMGLDQRLLGVVNYGTAGFGIVQIVGENERALFVTTVAPDPYEGEEPESVSPIKQDKTVVVGGQFVLPDIEDSERFGVVLNKSGMLSVRNLGERAITLLTAKNRDAKNDKALLGEVATWSLKPASAGKAFRVGPRLKLT